MSRLPDVERRHALVPVSVDVAQDLIAGPLPQRRVLTCDMLAGGYCNSIYKITLDEAPHTLVLRVIVHEPGLWRRPIVAMERVSSRVPVPRVYDAQASHPALDRPYVLLEWIEGDALADKNFDSGRSVGRTLAHIGSFEFPRPGLLDGSLGIAMPFGTVAEAMHDYFRTTALEGRAAARLGPALVERLQRHLETNVSYLERLPVVSALVHADYNAKNIMVRGNDVVGVIDWDFCFAGPPLADIGNLLRYDEPEDFVRGVLQGFTEEGGVLPTWWRRASRLLDLFSQLEFLNLETEHPQRFDDSLRLIRRMFDEWETLPE